MEGPTFLIIRSREPTYHLRPQKNSNITHNNLRLSDALTFCPTKQFCNSVYLIRVPVFSTFCFNIKPHKRFGVRAAQVEKPVIK